MNFVTICVLPNSGLHVLDVWFVEFKFRPSISFRCDLILNNYWLILSHFDELLKSDVDVQLASL
jgi:hypothetical protein